MRFCVLSASPAGRLSAWEQQHRNRSNIFVANPGDAHIPSGQAILSDILEEAHDQHTEMLSRLAAHEGGAAKQSGAAATGATAAAPPASSGAHGKKQ
jgi:hypothetical protein